MTDTHVDFPVGPASEKKNEHRKIPFRRKIKRVEKFNSEDLDSKTCIKIVVACTGAPDGRKSVCIISEKC
jgi:hypothetical protein